jgi:hypothetical protein
MTRQQRILAGALLIQIVLVAVVFWPRPAPSEAGGPLLTDFDPATVESIAITDDQGSQVELARQEDAWALASGGDYPANGEDVDSVLDQLQAIERERLVTQTEASHARLQVAADDFLRRIEVRQADGEARRLYIGASGGAMATHVRLEGEDEVYLTSELTAFDVRADAINWVDPIYLSLERDAIQSMVLENPQGRLVFERDEAGEWALADLAPDETFTFSNLSTLLSRLASLRLVAPVGTEERPEYGLDDPQAVVELTISGEAANRTVTVWIGAQAEEETYYARSSESEYVVRMANFTVEDYINRGREDFLQLPTTPTPEP